MLSPILLLNLPLPCSPVTLNSLEQIKKGVGEERYDPTVTGCFGLYVESE